MIYSMTGYGKAEANTQNGKYRVEIRSLNGKNADISIKTSLIPKDKELEVRKMITEKLGRGNIDLYINEETYHDSNKFEIVRNGDGSINLIVKNVINYIEK